MQRLYHPEGAEGREPTPSNGSIGIEAGRQSMPSASLSGLQSGQMAVSLPSAGPNSTELSRRVVTSPGKMHTSSTEDLSLNMSRTASSSTSGHASLEPGHTAQVGNARRIADAQMLSGVEVTLWRSTEYLMRITESEVGNRLCRSADLHSERPLWAVVEGKVPGNASSS